MPARHARHVGACVVPALILCQLTICDAQPVLELRLDADLLEPRVDLGAAAMHQDDPDADRREQHNVGDDTGLRGTSLHGVRGSEVCIRALFAWDCGDCQWKARVHDSREQHVWNDPALGGRAAECW